MKGLKLTDEEIRKIYLDRAIERFGIEAGTQLISQLESINNAQDVAKAQRRKFAEWILQGEPLENEDGKLVTFHRDFTEEELQALFEEVKE